MSRINKNYVYILLCSDKTLYTGWTTDLETRIIAHNSAKGAKYTRGRLPVELVYSECYNDKREAMRRECQIKKMTRLQKQDLIERSRK